MSSDSGTTKVPGMYRPYTTTNCAQFHSTWNRRLTVMRDDQTAQDQFVIICSDAIQKAQVYWNREYSRILLIRSSRFVGNRVWKWVSVGCRKRYLLVAGNADCLVGGRPTWPGAELPREGRLRWNMGEDLWGKSIRIFLLNWSSPVASLIEP